MAALGMSDQVDLESVKKLLEHINIWNGSPVNGMIEYLLSGRDCESMEQNLENYPYLRDDTFAYMSDDLMIKCW